MTGVFDSGLLRRGCHANGKDTNAENIRLWPVFLSRTFGEVPGAENRRLSDWGGKFGAREDAIAFEGPDDGVVSLDRSNGVFTVATPRTCGLFASGGSYRAGALACRIDGGFATVCVTSLDGLTVDESRHLLVSHLTDCRGDGASAHWDEKGRYVSDSFGRGGWLLRTGRADVMIRTKVKEGWKVHALAASGRRRFELPVWVGKNGIAFKADIRGADGRGVMEYELITVGTVP